MKNVPPSEKLRKEIDEILSGQLRKDEDLLGLMIERSLRDKRSGKSLLSKDGVSELTEEFWGEYERFCERDLSGYDLVYMFADAVFESLREQSGMKEAIL